jgi:hypothetical protein
MPALATGTHAKKIGQMKEIQNNLPILTFITCHCSVPNGSRR